MGYDLVIKNGIVVDGSGSPPFRADVGIVGSEIKSIGDLSGVEAERVVDASGLVVSPGFIDMHNHSDLTIFEVPTADNYVLQGVTTIVVGNCGYSPAPLTDVNYEEFVKRVKREHPEVEVRWRSFGEYVKSLEELKPAINIALQVGHGTIRAAVLGFGPEKPSDREIQLMKELAKEAMEAGAFGVSTGLIYVPGTFASTEEIIEIARVAASYGGIYSTHMRNEGVKLLDSVFEAVSIGLKAGVGVEISHLKASGKPSWGKVWTALKIIEDYASRGHDISADAYPYYAASTSLVTLLPKDVRGASSEEIMRKLREPNVVDRLRERLGEAVFEERYISWSDIMISYSPKHGEFEGMRLDKIAESMGVDPVEAMVRLLLDDELATGMVTFTMREEDVRLVISHPLVAIGSDGSVGRFGIGKPHPRRYGTFPRVIARYVREEKALSLHEAIRKMTSLPARKLRLWNRGLIRPGFKADLVVFNYYSIEDTATFENPHSYPKGIKYVIINGEVVADSGKLDPRVRAGKVLRRGVLD
ncbi:MAG: D-aminoacylase [Sulfolobales archaeon]|nr:D-aminoacylase [Sulfolobales archaeon]MCX8208642.1 D-aminoacylase [Sulfolobales archaeon]MDW8010525.1 D-aminoacylase [Sulfolobales archaeon]